VVKAVRKAQDRYEGDMTKVGEEVSSLAAGELSPHGTQSPVGKDPVLEY
jgi:hypothetical protein